VSEYSIDENELDEVPELLRGRFVEAKYSEVLNSKAAEQKPNPNPGHSILPLQKIAQKKIVGKVQPTPSSNKQSNPPSSYKCILDSTTWTDPCVGFPCFVETTDCQDDAGYLAFFGVGIMCDQKSTAERLDAAGREWWKCASECVTSMTRHTLVGNAVPCCSSIDDFGMNTTNIDCMLNRCDFCSMYENNLVILNQIFQSTMTSPYYTQYLEFLSYCVRSPSS